MIPTYDAATYHVSSSREFFEKSSLGRPSVRSFVRKTA